MIFGLLLYHQDHWGPEILLEIFGQESIQFGQFG